jgi:hypothetical protein
VRDGVALAVLAVAVAGADVWVGVTTTDLPPSAAPNATFDVSAPDDGTVVVEHAGGEPVPADAVRLLVYDERRLLPDRTVHASTWADAGRIRPGDRRRLEDPRFEPGQRVVVRWFGPDGQATLTGARL